MLLKQYEQSLLWQADPAYAGGLAQAQAQAQAQAAYSVTHPGVAVPAPALHRTPSHAPSMNHRPPSVYQPAGSVPVQYYQPRASAYGAVPTMSISGISQSGRPGGPRKPTYQPYEQWADHE